MDDSPADTADTADAVPSAPFATASGWERFEYANWLEEEGLRSCDMYWSAWVVPAFGCDHCAYGFAASMTLEESQTTDDGSCAAIHADRQQVLAYLEDFEGQGPSLLVQVEGRWFWWAWAEPSDTGLRWWFGWEDYQAETGDDAPPGHEDDWLTSYWNSEIVFAPL